MSVNKNDLRRAYMKIRATIVQREAKNMSISKLLSELLYGFDFRSFFVYVSMKSEADTHLLIENLIQSGKKVCIPRTKGGIMSVIMLNNCPKSFSVDKQGNLLESENLPTADFVCDCAIVPLIAYNDELYRIGYGGGYYDKFLKDFEGVKIGLAYDEQYCAAFEPESHDIKLDFVVTPTKISGGCNACYKR